MFFWHLTDKLTAPDFVAFSNRPVRVKHFQAINDYLSDYPHCNVDAASSEVK